MPYNFVKYSATGNDFVILDNRKNELPKDPKFIETICDRKWGVGADGLLYVENSENYDFKMFYANRDGHEAEMCGNGARSIIHYFHSLINSTKQEYQFETLNGVYKGHVNSQQVKIQMVEISDINKIDFSDLVVGKNTFYINTGVPHAVIEVDNLKNYNVVENGRNLRNHDRFSPNGVNVNYFERISDQNVIVRTYERGVEDETLSCGTGVTAVALAMSKLFGNSDAVHLSVSGGDLTVEFDKNWENVYLCGPAKPIFKGEFFWSDSL